MIKAIETSYKGFRFRSRLEARWAVYFDSLGVRWEYEKEGYDLGELGYYLPDFWLPETSCFVEVKPPSGEEDKLRTLYLAGKFTGGSGKNTPYDWREDFGFDLKSSCFDADDLPVGEGYPTNCGYLCVGPFSVDLASGHGSSMGHFEDSGMTEEEHLAFAAEQGGIGNGEYQEYLEFLEEKAKQPSPALVQSDPYRRTVLDKCLANIDLADLVFAWIHTEDCYGTLVEIGYAKAKGKRVIVGVLDELANAETWFAQQVADVCVKAKSPRQAFDFAFPLSEEEEKANRLASLASSNAVVVYGDPVDYLISTFKRNGNRVSKKKAGIEMAISAHPSWKIDKAALAARSARFEHGETPK